MRRRRKSSPLDWKGMVVDMISELQVGVITQTHGIKGEVKVFPTTDDANRFKKLKEVIMDTGRERLTMEIEGVKFFKQYAILKFKGYDSINDVEKYRSKGLYVPREQAVPLEEGEYYIADLLGMKVLTEDGGHFGTLRDVMQTGANDVYVIDSLHSGEVLLPAIADCILEVSVEQGWMKIRLLEGLLD